jgi:hypothetical protein
MTTKVEINDIRFIRRDDSTTVVLDTPIGPISGTIPTERFNERIGPYLRDILENIVDGVEPRFDIILGAFQDDLKDAVANAKRAATDLRRELGVRTARAAPVPTVEEPVHVEVETL